MYDKSGVYHHYASFIGVSTLWMHHFTLSVLLFLERPYLGLSFILILLLSSPMGSYLFPFIRSKEHRVKRHQKMAILGISLVGAVLPPLISSDNGFVTILMFSSHSLLGLVLFTFMCHSVSKRENSHINLGTGVDAAVAISFGAQITSIMMVSILQGNASIIALVFSNVISFIVILATGYAGKELINSVQSHYESQLNSDPLTSVMNRRGMLMHFDKLRKSARESQSLCLIVVDIDYFKKFNDSYGHARGDECLIEVANHIEKIRKQLGLSVTARFGGEEFVLMGLIEDPESLFSSVPISEWSKMPLKQISHNSSPAGVVTLSAGLGLFSNEYLIENNFTKCFEPVDELLYQAKSSRNMIVTASYLEGGFVEPS